LTFGKKTTALQAMTEATRPGSSDLRGCSRAWDRDASHQQSGCTLERCVFHCFSTVFDWCSMFFYSAPRANEPMSTNLSTNGAPMSTNSVMEQEMANRRAQPHKR
jgi:hypothetical protein